MKTSFNAPWAYATNRQPAKGPNHHQEQVAFPICSKPSIPRSAALCLAAVLVAVFPAVAHAQAITPVWEYLIIKLPSPLPILTNATPVDALNGTRPEHLGGAVCGPIDGHPAECFASIGVGWAVCKAQQMFPGRT